MDALTLEQLRIVVVLYSTATVPLLLIPLLHIKRLIPSWVLDQTKNGAKSRNTKNIKEIPPYSSQNSFKTRFLV